MELRKRMKNLTGLTFGSLTAIRPIKLTPQGTVLWEFKCVCGTTTDWIGNNVVALSKKAINPEVPSCGCVRNKKASETWTTHGFTKHPLHYTWQSMKQRCYNPTHPEYPRYGGKGVLVCEEWKHSAVSFINWALENGWEKGKHLDKDTLSDAQKIPRIYSPSTCQFISRKQNVGYSAKRENHLNNPRIKLHPKDVSEIQQLYQSGQLNQYELADLYGVKQSSIWQIIHLSLT